MTDLLDTNHFRYCGEYLDAETGRYYLRARYYDPLIGRFTQRDTHWNTANMIYGDNPQKINEREDKLGLKTYSYVPQITAIMQSGNLYVYGINNPIQYYDKNGKLATEFKVWLDYAYNAMLADGPAPVGDIIAAGIVIVGGAVCLVGKIGEIAVNTWDTFASRVRTKVAERAENDNSTHNHHIVAKGSFRAEEARKVLESVNININSQDNLIALKKTVHYYVHTEVYYAIVNQRVIDAYNRGRTYEEKCANVNAVLAELKALLNGLNSLPIGG